MERIFFNPQTGRTIKDITSEVIISPSPWQILKEQEALEQETKKKEIMENNTKNEEPTEEHTEEIEKVQTTEI